MLNKPRDFVGNILAMMLSERFENPEYTEKIQNWKMTVCLRTNFYPIILDFNQGVTITRDPIDNPTLDISMDFDTMIVLIRGKSSMMKEVLRGRIKIRGLFRHPLATFRFYRLMQSIIGA